MALELEVIILSVPLAVGFGWAIGANDAANALGAAFGAGALSARRGAQIAALCEFVGAAALSGHVQNTLAAKVLDAEVLERPGERCGAGGVAAGLADREALANVAALAGAAVFLSLASVCGVPASSTHSVVAAIAGVGLAASCGDSAAVKWHELERIAASWIVSPLLGAILGASVHCAVVRLARVGARAVGIVACLLVTLLLAAEGGDALHSRWPSALSASRAAPLALLAVVGVTLASACRLGRDPAAALRRGRGLLRWSSERVVWSAEFLAAEAEAADLGLPRETPGGSPVGTHDGRSAHSPTILGKAAGALPPMGSGYPAAAAHLASSSCPAALPAGVRDEEVALVAPLLVLAGLMSVAHGSNDVANATGPLVAVLAAYGREPASGRIAWPTLAVGGGIALGVIVHGKRVMRAVGTGIIALDIPSAFSCQLGTVSTVLLASRLGLPVSTTHVLIGTLCGVAAAAKVHGRGDAMGRATEWGRAPSGAGSGVEAGSPAGCGSSAAADSLGPGGTAPTATRGAEPGPSPTSGLRLIGKIVLFWVLTLPGAALAAAAAFKALSLVFG